MAKKKTPKKDWYKISVETIRGWAAFLFVLALAAAGFFGYRTLERYLLEREAVGAIDEARILVQRLQNETALDTFQKEYDDAWKNLQQARTDLGNGFFSVALTEARRSRTLLVSILDALSHQGPAGEAQFIAVQGGVEYRRADDDDWEEARSRVVLRSGDYVKTAASGSAEIMFVDGTLYTVRPNTLFLVARTPAGAGGRNEQTIAMEYGWLNLNTAQNQSKITTPGAEARVERDSEAVVAFDQASHVGRFAAYQGGMEVSSKDGGSRRIGALEQVVQRSGSLSNPSSLPVRPSLTGPADNLELDLVPGRRLVLRWEGVPRAQRYALQVSRNRLFVDNVIDVENRTTTEATLAARGEGTFLWRVAALDRDGVKGPWSATRSFRLVAHTSRPSEGDKTPPTLEVTDLQSYGSIFILAGRTEPGVELVVNGEPVTVEADGSFTKTIQLSQEGWGFVELRARDSFGNETVRRRRVFVESL